MKHSLQHSAVCAITRHGPHWPPDAPAPAVLSNNEMPRTRNPTVSDPIRLPNTIFERPRHEERRDSTQAISALFVPLWFLRAFLLPDAICLRLAPWVHSWFRSPKPDKMKNLNNPRVAHQPLAPTISGYLSGFTSLPRRQPETRSFDAVQVQDIGNTSGFGHG